MTRWPSARGELGLPHAGSLYSKLCQRARFEWLGCGSRVAALLSAGGGGPAVGELSTQWAASLAGGLLVIHPARLS